MLRPVTGRLPEPGDRWGRGIMAANNVVRSMLAIIVTTVTAGVIGTSFGTEAGLGGAAQRR